MKPNLLGQDSVTAKNAYASRSSAGENVEGFNGDVERAMADSDSKYQIITGDFNTKSGTETKEHFKTTKVFGMGVKNKRLNRLTGLHMTTNQL